MSDRSPATIAQLVIEALNAGDLDTAETYIADEAVNHAAPPGTPPGPKAFRAAWEMLRGAFPDFHFVIEESVEAGELVCSRYTDSGVQKGEFAGLPASGRRMEILGLDMIRVRDGLVVEHWSLLDVPALMQQLGGGE
jgi:steroid delta-isomerase-like uncharacterized protein